MESSACSIFFDSCWRMIEVQHGLMLDSWQTLRQPTEWGYRRWGCSWGMPPPMPRLDRSSSIRFADMCGFEFYETSRLLSPFCHENNDKYEESCPVLAVFTRGVQCINYNLCKHRMYIKCIKPQPRWNEYMIRVYRCVLFYDRFVF